MDEAATANEKYCDEFLARYSINKLECQKINSKNYILEGKKWKKTQIKNEQTTNKDPVLCLLGKDTLQRVTGE